ncbi:hypothetical protein EU537_03890 [Candidatus Thorarchaeota archaeon]|nr:MAG: hypothetical protein EU537_03890 [Candidatus Thorarchaeota archaeon]
MGISNAAKLLIAGLLGGSLGAVRAVILITADLLGLHVPFGALIINAITLSAIFLTGLGFFGLHMGLDSVFGYRSFQVGVLTCVCYLCYILQKSFDGRTDYVLPAILGETLAETITIIGLLLLFSTSLFLMLCGLTLVRFGYGYSFGPELSWTGFFYILASFGIFTPIEYIFLLVPFLLSTYIFYSLAKWVD